MIMEQKKCLECGEPITGRPDKKFCSDYCRNTYNNKLNSDVITYVRKINHILRKNRRILEELNPYGKTKVNKEKMLSKGFNFNFFTNVYQTQNGNTYYFCYDQGYLPIDNDFFALVKRKEHFL